MSSYVYAPILLEHVRLVLPILNEQIRSISPFFSGDETFVVEECRALEVRGRGAQIAALHVDSGTHRRTVVAASTILVENWESSR